MIYGFYLLFLINYWPCSVALRAVMACEMVRHCEARSNPEFGARNSGLLR